MRKEYSNKTPVVIDRGAPSMITSPIVVSGLEGKIRDVNVTFDIDHTWTDDLEIFLVGPSGERVLLVGSEGGDGDNFKMTTFDEAATQSIFGAVAPFAGTFRPEGSLTAFDNQDPNGTWNLHVEDQAFQDGGVLNSWSINIETCCNRFENHIPVLIDPGPPNTIRSTINVTGLTGMVIDDIDVTVDIEHTWDRDLTIALISPDGGRIVLVDREGGSRDHFRDTTFDDEADTPITNALPPFSGRFRPEGDLSAFENKLANGGWTLEITDHARHDGGQLKRWSMRIMVKNAAPPGPDESQFAIEVRFQGGLTANQRAVFELAAMRWSEIIVGDLPSVNHNGEIIDDVIIAARGTAIDGRGRILGQAGPTILRSGSLLPARGVMSFDTADLASMETRGTLVDVITHEMGHVLGIGTIWSDLGFLQGAGTIDPTFVGQNAMREYQTLTVASGPTPVPVANTGGPGTRDGHWREAVFGNELMTGFVEAVNNPISRLTVAALEDLGYEVNYAAVDAYILPLALRLAEMGLSAVRAADHGGHGMMFIPDREVLPPSAFVG